jgi:hypothetical protein
MQTRGLTLSGILDYMQQQILAQLLVEVLLMTFCNVLYLDPLKMDGLLYLLDDD